MASNYVIDSIKLCLDVANYEYILCNFDGPIVSAFEVIGVPPKHPTRAGRRKRKKKTGLYRVKLFTFSVTEFMRSFAFHLIRIGAQMFQ